MTWQPSTYESFITQRTQPALDLLARVTNTPHTILDMGCGTGNSTTLLCNRWPQAQVIGIDQSATMLQHVNHQTCPAQFINADMTTYTPTQPCDLLFSNAALHWVDHPLAVLIRWSEWVAPHGELAVQWPLNFHSPAHQWVHDTLRELGLPAIRVLGQSLPDVQAVTEALADHYRALTVWDTTYYHVLPDSDGVVTWMEGAGLRPVKAALTDIEWVAFIDRYRLHIHDAYPSRDGQGVVFPFTRRFIHGSKG